MRVRLVYLCKEPALKEKPMHWFVFAFYTAVIVLLALLMWPNGMIWILAEKNIDMCQVFA